MDEQFKREGRNTISSCILVKHILVKHILVRHILVKHIFGETYFGETSFGENKNMFVAGHSHPPPSWSPPPPLPL